MKPVLGLLSHCVVIIEMSVICSILERQDLETILTGAEEEFVSCVKKT